VVRLKVHRADGRRTGARPVRHGQARGAAAKL